MRGSARGPLAHRLAAPFGVAAGVGAAVAGVAAVDPNRPGHYPACPLLRWTGLYCPGCGGLRGLHALAHGDLGAALGANALAVAGYAAFAVLWVLWLARVLRSGGGMPLAPRARHWWALGGIVLAFTLVRNLPFGSALAP
ncbi:DUF2752 domain-containing protein [Streptomyces griseocarneus]|uniref:DUF2752 domain-containing protein n=1 Tax=Streptomyces griseocarneus TaxID=51201 RepID=UPI00167C5E0D|nr:DUF2752 domain-containing protein [Streptomyces griseocarneus]MBZ6471937.1 DUF2752 domain-containing protein [Streptomyces griseocarneus]GHG71623.1 membrane protein [Streptomyces griseocarneus]